MNNESHDAITADNETKHKGIIRYCIAVISILGLFCCIPILFPYVRGVIIEAAERFVFHQKIAEQYVIEAQEALSALAVYGTCFILFIDFWTLTAPGRFLLNKIGFIDVRTADILRRGQTFLKRMSDKRFEIFTFFIGFAVLAVAISRAANTGVTTDEANTYLDVVLPDIFEAILRSQALNNHPLNTILIRFVCFITQTQFNEFFIRLPSLLSYIVYIIFAYRIAKNSNHRYFIFILFIANYYLNEFFGLARGYGMAAACMTGAFYYFDILKTDIDNKRYFHCFMIWCSLAALANGIALYTIFSALVIIIFKYRKNIIKLSNCPYFLVFLFVAAYVVLMSRPGQSLASTHNFYECIIAAVFDTFSISSIFLTRIIFIVFIGMLIYGMIKTGFKNDYGLMYIIFVLICFISNIIFHRGYPLAREMIPFYPLVVFIIADALKYIKSNILTRSLLALTGILLCFQFIIQINTKGTKDWSDSYKIRNEVITYAIKNNISTSDDKEIIQENLKPLVDRYGVVGRFYVQKLILSLKE